MRGENLNENVKKMHLGHDYWRGSYTTRLINSFRETNIALQRSKQTRRIIQKGDAEESLLLTKDRLK